MVGQDGILELAGAKPSRVPRVAILRGDVRGATGWGHATRAIARMLEREFDRLYTVDIYPMPPDRQASIELPVISERDIPSLASRANDVTVFNFCMPHDAIVPPACRAVSYFFCETDTFPPDLNWVARLKLHDQIWVPSDWQRDVVLRYLPQCDDRVFLVPWPQEREPGWTPDALDAEAVAVPGASAIDQVRDLDRVHRELARDRSWKLSPRRRRLRRTARVLRSKLQLLIPSPQSIEAIFSSYDAVFFAIQTDVPRKGLPVLAAAWANHVARANGRSCLLIRYASVNVAKAAHDNHVDFSRTLWSAFDRARAQRDIDMHVYVIHDHVSEEALLAIMHRSRALVTATFGEGFGGPIADAVRMRVPVIAPRHTALEGLLPADYPLIVKSESFRGPLIGNLSVYSPSAQWHVPDARHLASLLDQLSERPFGSEDARLVAARDALYAFCGADAVLARLRGALAELVKG